MSLSTYLTEVKEKLMELNCGPKYPAFPSQDVEKLVRIVEELSKALMFVEDEKVTWANAYLNMKRNSNEAFAHADKIAEEK